MYFPFSLRTLLWIRTLLSETCSWVSFLSLCSRMDTQWWIMPTKKVMMTMGRTTQRRMLESSKSSSPAIFTEWAPSRVEPGFFPSGHRVLVEAASGPSHAPQPGELRTLRRRCPLNPAPSRAAGPWLFSKYKGYHPFNLFCSYPNLSGYFIVFL